jgi:hypothetical protein
MAHFRFFFSILSSSLTRFHVVVVLLTAKVLLRIRGTELNLTLLYLDKIIFHAAAHHHIQVDGKHQLTKKYFSTLVKDADFLF